MPIWFFSQVINRTTTIIIILVGVRNNLLVKSDGFEFPQAHPYLVVSGSSLNMLLLLFLMLLTTLLITRFFIAMFGRNRCPRHEASRNKSTFNLVGLTSGCLFTTLIRFVTVSIPSNVPLYSFNGIENFEINDVDTARLHAFAPVVVGVDKM